MAEHPHAETRPPDSLVPRGGPRSHGLRAIAIAIGIGAIALSGIAFVTSPMDTFSCRLNGYDSHDAYFREPGLMDSMVERAEQDLRIQHYRNLPGDHDGLPLDDPELQDQWSAYGLTYVTWSPYASDEPLPARPWIYRISLHGNDTEANLRVSFAAFAPGDHSDQDVYGTIRDVLGRLANIPQDEQEPLLLDLAQQAQARNPGQAFDLAATIEASWLRLGDLYRELSEQEPAHAIRGPVGDTSVQWESIPYSYGFRTLNAATIQEPPQDPILRMTVHTDDVAYIARNADPDDPKTRISDKDFEQSVRTLVQDVGIEEPTLQDFTLGNRCKDTCVQCGAHSLVWEA